MSSMSPSSADPDTTEIAAEMMNDAAVVSPPETYVIPTALAQATLNYLANRPYAEVAGLIHELQALKPVAKNNNGS